MENSEENDKSIEILPLSVKIKQERLTPPPESLPKDRVESESKPTVEEDKPAEAEVPEQKKPVEPIKSSNEILTELFGVFNSIPPEELLNTDLLQDVKKESKRKKKSKDKESKKHKKRKHKDEPESSGGEAAEKEHRKKKKLKKVKQEAKSENESGDEKEHKKHHRKSKKRKRSKTRRSAELDPVRVKREEETKKSKEKSPILAPATSSKTLKSKIVITNLKDSQILRASAKEEKKIKKSRSSDRDSGEISSEFSLSEDEPIDDGFYHGFYDRGRSRDHHDRSYKRDRSRDSRDRRHYSRDRYHHNDHYRRRQNSSYRSHRSFSRSRSRSGGREHEKIDKKRLLEIARKNAITMLKSGTLPGSQHLAPELKEKALEKMRFGGKTVEELTEYCRKMSNGEGLGDLSSVSDDDSDHDREGNDKAFHHPFVLKERGPIVMNIQNSIPIAPKTAEQTKALLMQFPVSSGQQHRANESEWVPVKEPKKAPPPPAPVPPPPKKPVEKPAPAQPPPEWVLNNWPKADITNPIPQPIQPPIVPPAPPPQLPPPPLIPTIPSASLAPIFPDAKNAAGLDIANIITKRLNAMRKLQDNPHDYDAISLMNNAQKDMTTWVNSKFTPGQFTGSTGANILTARELSSGKQTWAKRDQLTSTVPVSGGMGMHLLQKMGWKPGEGLGKEKNGSLIPLLLEVKLDKKGLVANEENPQNIARNNRAKRKAPPCKNLESKHPVSLLGELAAKRKWTLPMYDVVNETGPGHHKNFIFKVSLNGKEYTPDKASATKKEAKAVAARFCLQQMGILPT